jgi:hypothetical protein
MARMSPSPFDSVDGRQRSGRRCFQVRRAAATSDGNTVIVDAGRTKGLRKMHVRSSPSYRPRAEAALSVADDKFQVFR